MTGFKAGSGISPLTRTFWPVLGIVFLGVLVSALLAYFYTRQTVTDLSLGYTRQSLRFLDREIDTRLTEAGFELLLWSGEDVFRLALEDSYLGKSARKAAFDRILTRALNSPFNVMFLANSKGEVLVSSDSGTRSTLDIGDRHYFQKALAGEFSTETVVDSRTSGFPTLVLASPIKNSNGSNIGVLVGAININGFAMSTFNGMQVSESGSATILGQDGTVLASTRYETIARKWPAEEFKLATLSANRNVASTIRRKGRARLLMAQYGVHNGWLLIVEADKSRVLRPATNLGWISGVVSFVTLILVVYTLAGLQRALRKVRESEEKFSKLFLLSPDAIALLQLPDLTIRDVNESFDKLLGINRDAARGRTLAGLRVFAGESDASLVTATLLREGKIENLEFVAQKADGKKLNCVLSSQVVELESLNYLIVIIRDISEIKHMHGVLLQSEKMMSLGGLAAGMAHEINNPLAGIIGYAQVIKKRIFGNSAKSRRVAEEHGVDIEQVREYLNAREIPKMLDGIHDSGARAAQIVSNMLSFSRKSEKKYARHDLTALLENSLELASNDYDLKKNYDFRKIKIIKEFAPQLPQVHCEAGEIQQVFLNLLKNGADAMSDKHYENGGPCFTLRTGVVEGMVQVEIQDNGPGLDKELQRRIFEPFFTTKKVGKGTGLGLSVCYFIITDQHRGSLAVQSAPGQWTRFVIRLPSVREENEGHADD